MRKPTVVKPTIQIDWLDVLQEAHQKGYDPDKFRDSKTEIMLWIKHKLWEFCEDSIWNCVEEALKLFASKNDKSVKIF